MQLLMIVMYNCCDYGLLRGEGTHNSDNWQVRELDLSPLPSLIHLPWCSLSGYPDPDPPTATLLNESGWDLYWRENGTAQPEALHLRGKPSWDRLSTEVTALGHRGHGDQGHFSLSVVILTAVKTPES